MLATIISHKAAKIEADHGLNLSTQEIGAWLFAYQRHLERVWVAKLQEQESTNNQDRAIFAAELREFERDRKEVLGILFGHLMEANPDVKLHVLYCFINALEL